MTWEEAVLALRSDESAGALVRACYYDDPLIEAAERFHASPEWTAMKAMLPAPGRALDFGAGRGVASYALAREGWDVVALEPDQSIIVGAGAIRNMARQTGLSITVHQGVGEAMPFCPGKFDLVVCRAVLHHARDLEALCLELARVLRPGGTFIATREHVVSDARQLAAFLEAHPLHRLYGGENAHSLSKYTQSIEAAGLRISRVLSPFASDVNLFPESRKQLRAKVAAKLHLPLAMIPWWSLDLAGFCRRQPGRLYSFVGHKP